MPAAAATVGLAVVAAATVAPAVVPAVNVAPVAVAAVTVAAAAAAAVSVVVVVAVAAAEAPLALLIQTVACTPLQDVEQRLLYSRTPAGYFVGGPLLK